MTRSHTNMKKKAASWTCRVAVINKLDTGNGHKLTVSSLFLCTYTLYIMCAIWQIDWQGSKSQIATVPESELYLLHLLLSLAVCCGTEDDVMALLFLLAGLPAVFLKGSISPDGHRMWSHETMSAQLRGATKADSLTMIKPLKINKYKTLC